MGGDIDGTYPHYIVSGHTTVISKIFQNMTVSKKKIPKFSLALELCVFQKEGTDSKSKK